MIEVSYKLRCPKDIPASLTIKGTVDDLTSMVNQLDELVKKSSDDYLAWPLYEVKNAMCRAIKQAEQSFTESSDGV